MTLFDTANVYSNGASEEILGDAIKGRRDTVLISTKTGLPMGDGPSDWGVSRAGLSAPSMTRCDASRPIISTCCNSTPSMRRLRWMN